MMWVVLVIAALFVAWASYRYRGRNDHLRGPGPSDGRHSERSAYWGGP